MKAPSMKAPLAKPPEKPLFIPLKERFFNDFEEGLKTEEYRPAGPGSKWNAKTCRTGRLVTLSHGYGKRRRLKGRVTGYTETDQLHLLPGWAECYAEKHTRAAIIKIELLRE